MKLTVEQQYLLGQRAGLGMALPDVLVSIGLSGDAIDDATHDAEIRALYAEGRSVGIERIRSKLTDLGLSGNASALRVLLQNRSDVAEDAEAETWRLDISPEQFRSLGRRIVPRVRAAFAYQRSLVEGGETPTPAQATHTAALRREWERLCK